MLWHLECIENPEAIKQPAVYSDISLFFFFFLSAFRTEKWRYFLLVFNYVVFIDLEYYESLFCWQFRNF